MFLASNGTKVAAISGWNGSYGSMGPGGHVRCLDLVMGAMTGAQWLERVILASEGGSAARSWPQISPKWLEFLVGMVHTDRWDLMDMTDI